jgi:alpha-beta hydrolase superfamily lysophospholipase
LTIRETSTGIRFGVWARPVTQPAPTLFILASSIEETLGDPYFRQAGTGLARRGYVCVAIDLPAHGREQRTGEPPGLEGWRWRIDRAEDIVAANNHRLSAVLDHLIAEGLADPASVAVCGTSRGGFLAMHFAASDPRVRVVAAYAPVTDLASLREFRGAEGDPLVASLALVRRKEDLARRAVWIIIGDRDGRVDTDKAVALARQITSSALALGLDARVDLHVPSEPRGHTTPRGAVEASVEWIHRRLNPGPGEEN